MGHFRGTIEGQRGPASRLGSKDTGLVVTCRGWDSGVDVEALHNEREKRDEFRIILNAGNGYHDSQRRVLGTLYINKKRRLIFKR